MRRRLFLYVILFSYCDLLGQNGDKNIINYGPEITKSGETIYSVTIDQRGLVYFAIAKGVLVYDGQTWDIFSLNGDGDARCVEYDRFRDRVFVGGLGTFGYLEPDRAKRFRYITLSDEVRQHQTFRQIWQVVPTENQVTFQSNEGLFIWNGGGISTIPALNTYTFNLDGDSYYSSRDGRLVILHQADTVLVWDQAAAGRESLFNVFPAAGNKHLLFYPTKGVFERDLRTNVIKPRRSLHRLVSEETLYASIKVSDSAMVFGTWSKGIVAARFDGTVLMKYNQKTGLASDGFYDIELDKRGQLWGGSEYGISLIDLKEGMPGDVGIPSGPSPAPVITHVTYNGDSIIYISSPDDTLRLNRIPKKITLHVASPSSEYFHDDEYQYILEGRDASWSSSEAAQSRTYDGLRNGLYVFRAKSRSTGVESTEGKLTLVISQPWYATITDNGGYLIGTLVAASLVVFGATYRLRHNQRRLISLVGEKTKEIESHEKELLTINKSLVETNDELDTFLYRSSHDLVSPVKSIKGLISLMKLTPGDHPVYIKMMEERISRLETILQEINDYVKNAKREPTKSPFRVRELVEGVWTELEFMDNAPKIKFQIDIDPELEINSDRERWKMIVSNLVSNAIKYHDISKPSPFIRIAVVDVNGEIRLTTEDNGLGIREELQGRLFEMFYRASEHSYGIGLGLFLVKKMTARLNGTIHLDSRFGEGTLVDVRIKS